MIKIKRVNMTKIIFEFIAWLFFTILPPLICRNKSKLGLMC
jgi:hypothetical protein